MINSFKFKKHFGQNFLTDTNLLSAMVKDAGINKNDHVVEVGTGAGALTEQIQKVAKDVLSFEIDKDLIPHLQQKFENVKNVKIVFEDVLKTSNEAINKMVKNDFHLIANLPYYITTELIFKFLQNEKCKSLTIMTQKEVAQRIVAKNGTKDYGILTVKLNALAECKICRYVPRTLFHPIPNVDSAIINIVKKESNINQYIFNELVDNAFAMRRKTLQNNLTKNMLTKDELLTICQKLNIPPTIRAEALTINQFKEISKIIEQIRQ